MTRQNKETIEEIIDQLKSGATKKNVRKDRTHVAYVKKLVESAEAGEKELHKTTKPTP